MYAGLVHSPLDLSADDVEEARKLSGLRRDLLVAASSSTRESSRSWLSCDVRKHPCEKIHFCVHLWSNRRWAPDRRIRCDLDVHFRRGGRDFSGKRK